MGTQERSSQDSEETQIKSWNLIENYQILIQARHSV